MSDQAKPNTTTQTNTDQSNSQMERNRGKIRPRRDDKRDNNKPKDGLENKIIEIKRVTKMHKGGRRMKISVFVVVGDKKGKVGLGIGKGSDVRAAQEKAVTMAKKRMVMVSLKGNTIPHEVLTKFKGAKVLIKPASAGTGIVAGSSVRLIAEVVGIKDMLGKILGADNKITNAYATLKALTELRTTRL